MNTQRRREKILETLQQANSPITGTELSKQFNVSRQIIVGDITVLRAAGHHIYATPRGYSIPLLPKNLNTLATICCRHDRENLQKELEIIIDNGGKMHEVIVNHPLYGEIRVNLFLSNRREIKEFMQKLHETKAPPLMSISDGIHYHTIEVPDDKTLQIIRSELKQAHILVEE